MADKSWGGGASGGFRIRTNATADERAAERALARDARAQDRAAMASERLDARATNRGAAAAAREAAREARRVEAVQRATADPHAAAAERHRSSGRKDVVREQRDTRGYTTVVDVERMRTLAKRGASVAGLAGAFGISEAAVRQALEAMPPSA